MTRMESVKLSDIIGSRGRYQTLIYLGGFYSWWFIGMAVVTVELLAPMVTIHWDWDAHNPNRTTFSSNDCRMDDILELNRTSNLSNSQSRLIYVSQYSRRTLTEELDLVCERSWLVSLANFMCMLGLCLGNVLLHLSEKYGRRPLIISATLLCVAVCVCMSFTVDYVMLAVCILLLRASTNQTIMLLFLQTVEIAPPKVTPYIGLFSKSGLLFGQTLLTCAAWGLKDWFHTQLFQTSLTLALPLLAWYVLESPAWLAVRGRYDEARKVLVTIVRRNGRKLEEAEPRIDAWLEQMKVRCEIETTAEKGKLKDLFKNRRITLYTLSTMFVLITQAFIYAGLAMNAESFGSGLYVDLTLSNVLSLGSVLITGLLFQKYSVRVLIIWLNVFEGISCFAYPAVYSYSAARTTISVLGRIFISPVFAVSSVYTNQIFPTSVRGAAVGFTSFVSYMLASGSPFTKELGEITMPYVPFILFAVLSLVSALIYKLLPETKGMPLIHTIEEMKNFDRKKKVEEIAVRTISFKPQHE